MSRARAIHERRMRISDEEIAARARAHVAKIHERVEAVGAGTISPESFHVKQCEHWDAIADEGRDMYDAVLAVMRDDDPIAELAWCRPRRRRAKTIPGYYVARGWA